MLGIEESVAEPFSFLWTSFLEDCFGRIYSLNGEDALVGSTHWRKGAGAAQELKMGRTMEAKDNKTMEPELLEELEESQCSTSRPEDDLKQNVYRRVKCLDKTKSMGPGFPPGSSRYYSEEETASYSSWNIE